jgi:hypothetical protein
VLVRDRVVPLSLRAWSLGLGRFVLGMGPRSVCQVNYASN